MINTDTQFNYDLAFSRNLGFLNPFQQKALRDSTVAIAGLGGTGGAQALALARMGIGNFIISDPDSFEVVNFNRQALATMSTLGKNKAEVCRAAILEINPEARVTIYQEGLNSKNMAAFLATADVVVDSLDFYCFNERIDLYRTAREFNQWVFTAPPLGFGFTMLSFSPRGMTFGDYFGFRPDMSKSELITRFIAGLSPNDYMLKYMDWSLIAPSQGRVPSVGAAPFMIAGAMATEVTSLLLGHPPKAAPFLYQFDAKLKKFWSGKYNKNSIKNRIRRHLIAKKLK